MIMIIIIIIIDLAILKDTRNIRKTKIKRPRPRELYREKCGINRQK